MSHSFGIPPRAVRAPILMIALAFGALSMSPTAHALTITGQPAAVATVGQAYQFQPSLSDRRSRYVYFRIQNKPAWASFSSRTGTLKGVPTSANIGLTSDIRITAYQYWSSASLPGFSIRVVAPSGSASPTPAPAPSPTPEPTNAAPVISGAPPSSIIAGQPYRFRPTASDPNGDALSFAIQGKPSWASFSIADGTLSGTPTVAGTYSGIQISVSDGTTSTSLAPFSITAQPVVRSATLIWNAPSTNIDGTPLTNLAGFRVLYGSSPSNLTQTVELPSPTMTSASFEDLAAGTYYFIVKAYTSDNMQSDASTMVSKTLQ